jgi:geranylgeranyl diphosphate synthase, type II
MKTFAEISEIINSEVSQLNWHKSPAQLYESIGYVLSIGGKSVRPALTLLACNMFSDDVTPAVKPALGN